MFKRTFFTHIPIEVWVLGIPSLILFILAVPYSHTSNLTNSFFQNIILYFSANAFLFHGLVVIYFYIFFRLCYTLYLHIKNKASCSVLRTEVIHTARSFVFWVLLIYITALTHANALSILFATSSLAHIAKASHTLLALDVTLFGTYTNNALNAYFSIHPFFEKFCVWSYAMLSYIIPLTLVVLLCTNTRAFRVFVISFFLASNIGLVCWYLIPATSPRGYIDINITHTDSSVLAAYKATPAPYIEHKLRETDALWIDPTGIQKNVSTFPSMHSAWACLVTLSLTTLFPEFAFVIISWCIALMVGAVAIYQHFAVDIFFGIIVSVLTYYIAHAILRFEDTYFTDDYNLMYVWNIFKKDTQAIHKKTAQ